tara:strand:- start:4 stop:696 length:693 start_codon:yes stop_codon:yes gene_type:complete
MELISIDASPIAIGIIGYLSYFYVLKNITFRHYVKGLFPASKASFYWIQITRLIAFIFMTIVPLVFINSLTPLFWSPTFKWTNQDIIFTLGLAAILIPLGAINSRGEKHLNQYPQVRMKKWNILEYIINILSWGIYLLGYEYLFRGILFLGLLPFFSTIQAISINTLLYTLAHLYKGKKETLGSIPLGIILCLITLETNTIWTAFTAHWIMASNNFMWSLHHQNLKKNPF